MAQHFKNYYNILDIPFSASEAAIKTAYRKMARMFHPDMHPEEPEEYTAKFQEITEAYETLSDNSRKEIYDQQYREIVLGEVPAFETYYYIEPQEHYESYQTYEPPRPKKRNTYAPYGGIALLLFLFIRLISSVTMPETATGSNAQTHSLPQTSRTLDSLIHAPDSNYLNKTQTTVRNPFSKN